MSDDNIIQFPNGGKNEPQNEATPKNSGNQEGLSPMSKAATSLGMPQLTADQEKAVQIIMSGMSYVCIGIKDTGEGADFFTAVDGDETELRNAQGHLDGVIGRAFDRKGI